MAWWKRSMAISWATMFVFSLGCGSSQKSDEDEVGPFVASADDEAIDPSDPPTDPDPIDPAEQLPASPLDTQGFSSSGCAATPDVLSPKGLTFVIHVSKRAEDAAKEVDHIADVRHYLRVRDVFMIEHGSPYVNYVRAMFPCNRVFFIAYPDEMGAALSTGDGIDGIAVDWEGSAVTANGPAWSTSELRSYASKIQGEKKSAGYVPAWGGADFDDATITRGSNMDFELAQAQGACDAAPQNFAGAVKDAMHEYQAHDLALRRLGFEISMDSFVGASNHVDAPRAADCTRRAYGKGARAIYIYGNGHDHLHDYFRELAKIGVRTPR